MEEKKQFIKVTKTYSRKVSLRGITSQYDNVDRGTFVTAMIGFSNEKELNEKLKQLSKLAFNETELDIADTINSIKKMCQDESNQALVGLGPNLEPRKLEEESDDLSDLLNSLENVPSGPTLNLEDVDDFAL